MHKNNWGNVKDRVTKDFNATLQTIIRSVSREELNIRDAFEQPDQREEFYLSTLDDTSSNTNTIKSLVTRKSIYRNKSFKKYELVVDTNVSSTDPTRSTETGTEDGKIYARLISKVHPSIEKKKSNNSKPPKYIQRFFPHNFKLPFASTRVESLPYHLQIDIENKEKLMIQVTEDYHIKHLKSKIYKRTNIEVDKQALFYKDKRLEGSSRLYHYNIKSNSQVQLKDCDSITIHGIFNSKKISLSFYTSVTISKIRDTFATEIGVDPSNVELKYNDTRLEENKELFVYSDIVDGAEIEVIEVQRYRSVSLQSQGYQSVNRFFEMTGNLKKCKCRQLRIGVMADLFQLTREDISNTEEIKKNEQLLREFDKERNFHHISCFKLSPKTDTSTSQGSSVSNLSTMSFSGSDNSLKSAVWAENKRVNKDQKEELDEQYIALIAECKEFKKFKHLIADKIGTKCNLRSVALLYKYTRDTVRYIGLDEGGNSQEVERILDYTKLYFEKYFKKKIVNKGGLDALTLSGADVD